MDNFLDSQELKVLIPAILGIICVLGFAGNITAMGVLLNNALKGKLTLINALILNLTLADSLVLVFVVPFKTAALTRAGWTLGWFVCKTCDWFLQSCMAAKSFTVAIMAKSCYRYVRNPSKQVSIDQKAILTVLLFVWLLACLVSAPHGLFAGLQGQGDGLACVQAVPPSARDAMAVYVKASPLVAFCAPLGFALLYFWRAYGRCRRRGSKTQNLRTQIRSRRLTIMLFGLTVAAATMWLPQWVAWVWSQHAAESGGRLPPRLFTLSAQLLMFSISLADPVIVLALSEEFRDGCADLWRHLTFRKRPPPKSKPGPHAPTAPKSPCPRPETSAHPPPRGPDGGPAEQPKPEEAPGPGPAEPGSPANKDGMVLPDLEQFWHERETGPLADENDPIPWEHQDQAEVKP
ncbi:G-protein coupled receptor 151-like [Megalops cyprinoides]|uniref:G-protein coupled receptor 151-like n=1 Tax=Megalops cyprinoides TaxID=118141 RepID=UPI001864AA16|nr:G-protein coupled receptor 151-like [Megalops cyprinoides]